METMPAIVYVGEGAIEVQRVDVPELGPGQVRIEVSHCGICGTDLHLVLEQMARPGSVLGHEWAGTIDAVGEGVTDWALGDRVVAGPGPGCGECRACRTGRPSVCLNRPPMPEPTGHRGAFAQYDDGAGRATAARSPTRCRPAPPRSPSPPRSRQHAVTLSGVTPEDRVLVTGAGPVGMLVTAVLHAQGVHDITVSEPAPARREHALKVGAARVITPDELPAASAMGAPVAEPYSVVFECSGRGEAAEAGLDQLDFAGTFVFVGTGDDVSRGQPQPGDHPREHDPRCVQLRRRRVGARARAARVGQDAARRADRAGRRAARRPATT